MPTYPTRTLTLDDATIATLDTYLETESIDQIFEHSLVLGLLYQSAKEPGVVGPYPKLLGIKKPLVSTQQGQAAFLPLAFNTSNNTETFYGSQVLKTGIDPVMTGARSLWSYYTDYAAISLTEALENTGPMAMLDIGKERINMVLRSLSDRLETDFWSTNTDIAHGSQDGLPGIQHHLNTTQSTGTVWGLNRANYTWWRANTDTVGSFATNGLDKLRTMWTTVSGTNAADPPSGILTTPTVWTYFIKQLEGIHRVNDNFVNPDLSFPVAHWMGIPVLQTSKCPSGVAYLVNFAYWRLLQHAGTEWAMVEPPAPNDQLIKWQRRVLWAGTWGLTRPGRQGILSGITA